MKSLQSARHRRDPIQSQTTLASPAPAKRSNEALTHLLIEDERMFREFEVQIRCDLDRFAPLGKPFTVDKLVHRVRGVIAKVAPLPIRKH